MTYNEILVAILIVTAIIFVIATVRLTERNRRNLIEITHIMEKNNQKADELIQEIGRTIERMQRMWSL